MTLVRQWNPTTQRFDGQVYKLGEGGPSGTSPSLTGNVPGSQTVEESTLLLTAAETSPSPEVAAAGHDSPPAPAAAQPSLFDLPPTEPAWA